MRRCQLCAVWLGRVIASLRRLCAMFTGIVRERAKVASFDRGRLVVESSLDPSVGDSVSADGVSLTIAALTEDAFEVALVRHTLDATTLGSLAPGDEVNLEVDVLAKYVERLTAR